jgi:hypothetical protein
MQRRNAMTQFVRTSLIGIALSAAMALPLLAQKVVSSKKGGGGSPHETVEWTIDGAKIQLAYGRPYLKGREIGKSIVPYGQVWRTGADEATTLVTDKPLMFGSMMVPAGTYTLYTMPTADEWKLIINKQTGQWGTEYHEDRDLGRIGLKKEKIDSPVDLFTISMEDTPGGGLLKLEWGTTRLSTPFMVH